MASTSSNRCCRSSAITTSAGTATVILTSCAPMRFRWVPRSEEHTSELQSQSNVVCRLLLEKKIVVGVAGQERESGQRGRPVTQRELRSLEALAARVQQLWSAVRADVRDDEVLEDHVEQRHVERHLAVEPPRLQAGFAAPRPLGFQDLCVFG